MSAPTIGILGGMGPRATVEFESRLVEAFEGGDQNIPTIISINSGSIPDRSNFLNSRSEDPMIKLVEQAKTLNQFNVDVVCMPCNTAHSPKILARVMAVAPLPIIDMPAACILKAEQQGYNRLLILGTSGTAKEGIFDSRSVSSSCYYPDTLEQQQIGLLISKIKSGTLLSGNDLKNLKNICTRQEVDAIILACTELSLLPKSVLTGFNVIDSTDILVDSCRNIVRRLHDAK